MSNEMFCFQCEQTAGCIGCTGKAGACILLTLLHLGIKNIKLGPSLPAFISPNILNFLVENYGIAPITTPEKDLAELLSN